MDTNDGFLTVREAAAALGVSVRTVQTRISLGQLPARRYGARSLLLDSATLSCVPLGKLKPGRRPSG